MKFKLNSIILYVHDVNRLKSFYTQIMGFEIVEEDDAIWTLLRSGNGYIGLHRIGKEYSERFTNGCKFESNSKIVFEIDDDIKLTRQKLQNRQVLMREIKTFDNYDYWLCDGEDPEGNVFQIKQRKFPTNINK